MRIFFNIKEEGSILILKKFLIVFMHFLLLSTIIYANSCPKWFPMPTSDGLVVVLQIYDESITEPDLDCDGIIDIVDNDIDGDGVSNAIDAFPLNSSETIDTDGDGIGNNADTDDDNDGTIDSEDSNPLVNEIPLANAGDDFREDINTTITLDASASVDDGNTLIYSWVLTSKPEGSTARLNNSTSITPSFYGDKVGAYRLELIVSDGILTSAKDVVFVNVGRESMLISFDDGIHGKEPWITDGTVEGTRLLKDINIKNESSNIDNMVNAGDVIYFSVNGNELWKSDGTDEGTVKVIDINNGQYMRSFTVVGNILYFVNAGSLWKSDGTESGTEKINGYYGNASDLMVYNNELYFSARAGNYGRELWKSNGTQAGTEMVKDIKVGEESSSPTNFLIAGNILYFTVKKLDGSRDELWSTGGVENNTVKIKDFNSTYNQNNIRHLTNVNGTLFFTADDGIHGRELWKSDGTTDNTEIVKDIHLGQDNTYFQNLIAVGNELYFFIDSVGQEQSGVQLWKSDGTSDNTIMVKQLGITFENMTIDFNGTLYFSYNGELWKSNGTETGTVLVKKYSEFGLLNLKIFNQYLYFSDSTKIWKSDGSVEGTYILKNIQVDHYSYNYGIEAINNNLVFVANDSINGRELWKSDGTTEGTYMVKNISTKTFSSLNNEFVKIGSIYYFIADDGVHGKELWKSDGTEVGTTVLKHMNSNGSDNIRKIVSMKNNLYFIANYENYWDVRLWKSDGTSSGTTPIVTNASSIKNITPVDNFIYFTKYGELWKSDGTTQGTILVKTMSEYDLNNFLAIHNILFFTQGNNLWRSDGSEEGTYILENNVQTYNNIFILNDFLYFTNYSDISIRTIWRTDGTLLGTIKVKENINDIQQFIVVDNQLYYTSDYDEKLWKSDTLLEHRELINKHENTSIRKNFTVNDTLYYTTYNALWKSTDNLNYIKELSTFNLKMIGSLNGELIYNLSDYSTNEIWKTNETHTIQLTP